MLNKKLTHSLFIYPEYFQAIIDEKKTFEIRNADQPFAVGDYIEFSEIYETTKLASDRSARCEIIYISHAKEFTHQMKGVVILGIKLLDFWA